LTAGAPPSAPASGDATFADRLPLLAMLTADALAIVGQAIAACLLAGQRAERAPA
jgi:hypothetical protein